MIFSRRCAKFLVGSRSAVLRWGQSSPRGPNEIVHCRIPLYRIGRFRRNLKVRLRVRGYDAQVTDAGAAGDTTDMHAGAFVLDQALHRKQ